MPKLEKQYPNPWLIPSVHPSSIHKISMQDNLRSIHTRLRGGGGGGGVGGGQDQVNKGGIHKILHCFCRLFLVNFFPVI